MRLLRLCKLRRYRLSPPPPPPLYQFTCHYSSYYRQPQLINSIHHHHLGRLNNNPGCSSELLRHLALDCIYVSRRFSSEPGVFEPDEPRLPVEASESDEPRLPVEAAEADEPRLPVEAAESDEPFFAVEAVISLLDFYHGVTGFPWWIVISTSTLAMRLALFPLSVVQLKQLRHLGTLLPRLPPPFPRPKSSRSFRDQIAHFLKEKKAAGGPSLLWFISSFAFQVPFFFLWITSLRRMSLNHHPGFDSGGTLWFQNLTEYPHGALGLIFPFCIAALHFTSVKLSFEKPPLQHAPDSLGSFSKLHLFSLCGVSMIISVLKIYRNSLLIFTLPILIATFSVPQGSLIYWLTNSTCSLIQQSCLRHPTFLKYLGITKMNASVETPTVKKSGSSGVADVILTKGGEIPAQSLSPVELVNYSIKILSDGRKDTAIRLLRLAIEKDPGFIRAWLIMGQTLVQKKQLIEAAECLESAISKLLVAGYPTEVEEVDLLILSSQWAGMAYVQQGKMMEGLVHLERVAQLNEPEDSKSKAHYYDGLVILSSALANMGREAEALNYLRMAAAYNPSYKVYVEELLSDSKELGKDLSSSKKQ